MSRVLISLPKEFLDEVDRFAEVERRSRSELIREALRAYMASSPAALKLKTGARAPASAAEALASIQKMRRDAQPGQGLTSEAWLAARRKRHG